ncbi:MAG: hypothetical protein JW940_23110 [Polyangiaceae bacterium]|nr:hypothetical protein [Polyangiaceae bacterium]
MASPEWTEQHQRVAPNTADTNGRGRGKNARLDQEYRAARDKPIRERGRTPANQTSTHSNSAHAQGCEPFAGGRVFEHRLNGQLPMYVAAAQVPESSAVCLHDCGEDGSAGTWLTSAPTRVEAATARQPRAHSGVQTARPDDTSATQANGLAGIVVTHRRETVATKEATSAKARRAQASPLPSARAASRNDTPL